MCDSSGCFCSNGSPHIKLQSINMCLLYKGLSLKFLILNLVTQCCDMDSFGTSNRPALKFLLERVAAWHLRMCRPGIASNLEAMASDLIAMASNLIAMASYSAWHLHVPTCINQANQASSLNFSCHSVPATSVGPNPDRLTAAACISA